LKTKNFLLITSLFLFNIFCTKDKEAKNPLSSSSPLEKENHFIITSLGDSVRSGVPVTIKGKLINPDSVSFPSTSMIKNEPPEALIPSNVHLVGTPKKVILPQPNVIAIGNNGVPFPETVLAIGESIPAIRPQYTYAAEPLMKDESITNLQYWNIDQGLNASHITDMLIDARGHIWMITKGGGVCRFDGIHLTHYTINDGLPFNDPLSIMEDSRGNIWMGGFQGLIRYDGNHFTHFVQKDGLFDPIIYTMYEDSRGHIWLGSNGRITRYTPGTTNNPATFSHYTSEQGLVNNRPIRAIEEDQYGNMWFGSIWGGMCRFEVSDEGMGGTFWHYGENQGFGQMVIASIMNDQNDNIWFGTSKGAYRMDITSTEPSNTIYRYTTDEGLSSNFISSMQEDSDGDIWFGTNNGVNQYESNGEGNPATYTRYTKNEGLSGNRIFSIIEDDQKNKWFATEEGLNRYTHDRFHYINSEKFNSSNVFSILEDSHGDLWFGTDKGIHKFDEERTNGKFTQSFKTYTTDQGLTHHIVHSFIEDSKGRYWVGLYNGGGVCRFDPEKDQNKASFTCFHNKDGLLTPNVDVLYEDRQGNIWIGGVSGLACYTSLSSDQSKGRFVHYTREEGFPSFAVYSILEDSNGNVWFGTQRGVSRLHAGYTADEGTFTHFTSNEGLSSGWITSIIEDAKGNMWFGTYSGGVSRYDPSDDTGHPFVQYTTEDGLSHNIIQSILEDDANNIWVSTQKGLSLLKPVSVHSDLKNTEKSGYEIHNFGIADGLKNINFTQGVVKDQKNRILWGTSGGVAILNIDQFKFSLSPPSLNLLTVEIEQDYIDYRRLTDEGYRDQTESGNTLSEAYDSVAAFFNYPVDLALPYDLNHLTFNFSATDWAAPHKIEYSYWLEGVDKDWTLPVSEPRADYRGLRHGLHTLKVRAIGESQIWSDTLEYSFRILPPWWLSTWAYIVYAIMGIMAVWGLTQWRTSTLRKRQKELEKTVKERTSEVVAQKEVIEKEKDRSEALLLNILPPEIAEELKQDGTSKPRDFNIVTVLFTDFKGFTKISENMSSQELVAELNTCFKAFDEIITKYKIEKIKTIGDAYMAAGGLHLQEREDPKNVVLAALEMQAFMVKRFADRQKNNKTAFEMRCGIHTGSVVAGIVGVIKFQYDIWGDTVNTAARMESSGEVGKVNLSEGTYNYLKDDPELSFVSRGKLQAKGKGEIEMYFVDSLKSTDHHLDDF